jgi:hypothetical protein
LGHSINNALPFPRLRSAYHTLSLANDRQWQGPEMPSFLATDLVGLIDTGSALCHIDSDLAQRYNLTKTGQVGADTLGGSSIVPVYYAQLCFPEGPLVFAPEGVGSLPLRATGKLCDIILGMEFVSLFDLHLRSKDGIVELEYLGP